MDLHGDALQKIMGDMDDMESNKMYPKSGGATITITVSPGDGDGDADDLPADHDISMCGGGCAMHKGGELTTTAEGLPGIPKLSEGGEITTTAEQLEADHDYLECKGKCPVHKGSKSGAFKGLEGDALSMAAGGQVPATPVPAEVDDTRIPPFLRKKAKKV